MHFAQYEYFTNEIYIFIHSNNEENIDRVVGLNKLFADNAMFIMLLRIHTVYGMRL